MLRVASNPKAQHSRSGTRSRKASVKILGWWGLERKRTPHIELKKSEDCKSESLGQNPSLESGIRCPRLSHQSMKLAQG
jgi:hypothetical protein